MKRWIAVTRALPTTFSVYVITTVFALGLGASLGIELESAIASPLGRPLTRVLVIERLWHLTPLLRAKSIDLAFAFVALLSLTPWLRMSWITSLSALHGPARAFRNGRTFYGRALLTSVIMIAVAVVLVMPWAFAGYGAHSFLHGRVNERVHDIAVALMLLPIVPALVIALVWHDLAHGRCLTTGAIRSVFLAAPDAFRLRVLARYLAWGLLGFAVIITAQLVLNQAAPEGPFGNFMLVMLTQGAAFLRAIIRSAWLTDALVTIDEAEAAKSTRNKR